MKIAIDTKIRFEAKPSKDEPALTYTNINRNLVNGWNDYSLEDIKYYILNGHSCSAGYFDGARKATKWQEQQTFFCDIDDIDSPTPEQAIEIIKETFGCEPFLVYKTFSSTKENNKYRVVIASDYPIDEPAIALGVLRGLKTVLKGDSKVVDLARLLFGTTPDKLVLSTESVVKYSTLIDFGERYKTVCPQNKKPLRNDVDVKNEVASLSKFEKVRLSTFLRLQQNYLKNEKISRYEKLSLLGIGIADLSFVSWQLAEYVISSLINQDEDLKNQYITNYDKDYLTITHNLYNWHNERA